jgi:hypothetical protein
MALQVSTALAVEEIVTNNHPKRSLMRQMGNLNKFQLANGKHVTLFLLRDQWKKVMQLIVTTD